MVCGVLWPRQKTEPPVGALEHLSSGKVFFFTLPLPTLTSSIHIYCGAKKGYYPGKKAYQPA